MKKQPTPEQKAKAEQRRAAMRTLAKNIAALSDAQRAELAARHPIVTIEGRALSSVNQCMLAMQCPTATIVGGFQQWKRAGRSVRKGEHGLGIWVPTGRGSVQESAEPGQSSEGTGADSGTRQGFIVGTVFDIAQTEEGANE